MKNKLFSIVSWSIAGAVLAGALVYYNFFDKPTVVEGVEVGDVCPDFTVETIVAQDGAFRMGDGHYTLSDHGGKVRVINFWATWCGGCILELPEFNEFAADHPEIEMIAIAGSSGSAEIVVNWMNNNQRSWTDFSLTFGFYGPDKNVYADLGGTQSWPMTIVLDEDGVIRYTEEAELNYEKLSQIVLPLLED